MDENKKKKFRLTLSKRVRNKYICMRVVFIEYYTYAIAKSIAVGQPIGSCVTRILHRFKCARRLSCRSDSLSVRRRRRPETVTLRTQPRIVLVPRGGGDGSNIHCVVGRGT